MSELHESSRHTGESLAIAELLPPPTCFHSNLDICPGVTGFHEQVASLFFVPLLIEQSISGLLGFNLCSGNPILHAQYRLSFLFVDIFFVIHIMLTSDAELVSSWVHASLWLQINAFVGICAN